jgi:LuxR family maltose regulon positive regulatory protein
MVPRPRLIERINVGLHRKLTLVSAPAGFGKTTLLAAWTEQCDRPVTWLTLDDGDNDPIHFGAYLVAALQKVCPAVGQIAASAFQAPVLASGAPGLTSLINLLVKAPEPFVLILDDYHVIHDQAVHQIITFLLDHQPPSLHLVIATRADPPLPLARLRGRGHLNEVYQADLRFTTGEAHAFLKDLMALDLSASDVDALARRTEGWIAGLQMAAISMQTCDDVAGFVQAFTGSHRYILDYLSEEVFRCQPLDIQTFLLQTAVLDRLCGDLCDAVMETRAPNDGEPTPAAQSVLEHLEHHNLFVVPLDDERRWYRYHHLFADLLRQRVQRETPELVPDLHRRASRWYAQHGWTAEAVDHALASGDFAWAIALILEVGWATFTRGEMTTVLDWIAALPDHLVREHPQVGILRAWALAKSGQLERVELVLETVQAGARQAEADAVPGEVAAVRAYVAGVRGDFARAAELAQRAFARLPEEDVFLRAIVAQNLGVAYHWNGDSRRASQTLSEAITLSRAAGQTYQTLTAMSILGRAYEMQAALRQAGATYREALQLAADAGDKPVPFAGMAYVGLAGVLYEQHDLVAAKRCAMEGIRLSKLGGFVAYQIFGYTRLAQVAWAQGEGVGAVDLLQKALSLGQVAKYALVMALAEAWRIRLWIAQGKVAAAVQWAAAHPVSTCDGLDAAREIEQTAVARVLIARGQAEAARDLLASLLDRAEASGQMGSVIKLLVLQALAFQAMDDVDHALSSLQRALVLAEPEGYVRTFVDEGVAMARLLRAALAEGIVPNYAAHLLAICDAEAEIVPAAMASLVEPLTEREVEVLRLIVAGLTNAEIADELYIAISTVKSHVNHIYGKLAVEHRTQAVIKAQELVLL